MCTYTYTCVKTGTFFAMAKFANLLDPVTQDFEVYICARAHTHINSLYLYVYI